MASTTSESLVFDVNNDQILNDEKLLASQIKQLEAISDQRLDASYPFVVRIDGVSFRNYTRGFTKPFDQRMTRAFIRTSADLLQRFSPLTVYYESDEISLVFDGCPILESTEKHPREHMYSGRIQKLVSVMASYTAAKFNKYINEEDWSNIEKDHVRERVASHSAYFDGRAFSLPNQFAAMASLYWRHRYDTLKNATLTYALSYYSPSAISGKSPYELRDLMHAEQKWDMLNEAPKNIIYGTFLKKELYDLESIDRKTQQPVIVKRSRIRIGSFNMHKLLPTNEEKIKFMMSKYWNDCNTTIDNVEIPEWWMKYYRQQETVTDE
jgi:tRNA(His) 5'-end guanylyltransferase